MPNVTYSVMPNVHIFPPRPSLTGGNYCRVVFYIMPPEDDGSIYYVSINPATKNRKAHLDWICMNHQSRDGQTCLRWIRFWDMSINPSPLLSLPPEVLCMILNEVKERADLERLLQACPRLYNLIIPFIWRTVNISLRVNKNCESEPTDVTAYSRARSGRFDRLEFVKRVVVKGTSIPQAFCIHRNRDFGSFFEDEGEEIGEFLSSLNENSLKGFIWATGTCMSPYVMGRWARLSDRHPDLEELSLMLNPGCIASQMYLHVEGFKRLKYLSLRGLNNTAICDSYWEIQDGLQASSSTLVELELAIVPETDTIPYEGKWDGAEVFPFNEVPWVRLLFPKLRVLHLEMISLLSCASKLAQAVDLPSLTSLTLRQCEGWDAFCHHMIHVQGPLRLKHLELVWYSGHVNYHKGIIEVLNRSPHIETVSICNGLMSSHFETLVAWHAICHGRTSLRGFVHHRMEFGAKMDCPSPLQDPNQGRSNDMHLLHAISGVIVSSRENPFTLSDLQFLGLCCFPTENLRGILYPLSYRNRLRVLHFRKSASNMNAVAAFTKALDHFAHWAFGREGIPSLQLILFGDYSTFKVRKGANCRYDRIDKSPFYTLKVDPDVSDLSPRFLSLVKACPTQYIMK
ncbi:hypothetical protein TSTA_057140 [Talaromyces stipitatus ATCC 10500]|uniref:F-box domain-containing protein n=1 Tax=Talaromyces stipitatus (strain ATCC 10500 / CBS 375.48 / QM 6759 / NRRL 1006) TaxID=441959 RepID=B8MRR1_TALSN|nr:uncharacterized protein TSTA_057140 [Talaromyces stipitatus ATCC 10500]EED13218.1 hypothetical protein TSTA_057140 [Talaromyces stipitatus ATCC 10500]